MGKGEKIEEVLNLIKQDYTLLLSTFVISILIVLAIFPQFFARYDFYFTNLKDRFTQPGLNYPLGTDHLGRDILSMLIWGCRVALIVILFTTIISASVGILLGIIAGYTGGMVDQVIMRIIDVLLAFPSFLLALVIINSLGRGLFNSILAISLAFIAQYVRLTRSLALSIKETDYIKYAEVSGASKLHITLKYILPNIISPIIVQMAFNMPDALLVVSGLSFLGLGVQPPTADWGVMMNQSRTYLQQAPYAAFFPGMAIFLVAYSLNTMGDTLSDLMDPRRRTAMM